MVQGLFRFVRMVRAAATVATTMVGAPLFGLVLLALMRISLEFSVAVITISEGITELKSRN